MERIKNFYNYINIKNKYNCVNVKTDYGFTKNHFIKKVEDLISFCVKDKNYKKDCYINYQPLINPVNRKTENVLGVKLLAFDIEYKTKIIPETDERKENMRRYIYKLIYYLKINNYMLIDSGNGYHLYVDIGNIIKRDKDELKSAYKNIIKYISEYLYKISSGLLSSDDRKDLAGILRIPFTYNTKAEKYVSIIEIHNIGNNTEIRKLFFRKLRKVKQDNIFYDKLESEKPKMTNIELPKNIDELILNPLVKIWFDKSLQPPKHGNWHNSIIFALQSLIYHSGLSKKYEITQLSREINRRWNTSSELGTCSYKKDLYYPIKCAIRFCKKNGYIEYEKELINLYIKKKDL